MNTTPKPDFPFALRALRKARDLSQEEFDTVSGRTYVSALERGKKDPTLGKVQQLAEVMKVHPLTLLTLTYTSGTAADLDMLLAHVRSEILKTLQGG
jgi:transcriptional regulator with XRE-family HTH domain